MVALHGDDPSAARVAANPSVPAEVFKLLAKRSSAEVLESIASNLSAPLELRRQIAPRVRPSQRWELEVQAALPVSAGPDYTARVLEHRLGQNLAAWDVALGLAPSWQQDLEALANASLTLSDA